MVVLTRDFILQQTQVGIILYKEATFNILKQCQQCFHIHYGHFCLLIPIFKQNVGGRDYRRRQMDALLIASLLLQENV